MIGYHLSQPLCCRDLMPLLQPVGCDARSGRPLNQVLGSRAGELETSTAPLKRGGRGSAQCGGRGWAYGYARNQFCLKGSLSRVGRWLIPTRRGAGAIRSTGLQLAGRLGAGLEKFSARAGGGHVTRGDPVGRFAMAWGRMWQRRMKQPAVACLDERARARAELLLLGGTIHG